MKKLREAASIKILVLVGAQAPEWFEQLQALGWTCHLCSDLRTAHSLIQEIGPCIAVVDLSRDTFSLNGVAHLVNAYQYVRWMALIRDQQVDLPSINQFIVHFCIDFFVVPIPSHHQLLATLGHQLGMVRLEQRVWQSQSMGVTQFTGQSSAINHLRQMIKRWSYSDVSVFIHGDVGVGKERLARAIHESSSRAHKPFSVVRCAALSDYSLETQVFGIGIEQDTISVLEKSHGGTVLFYDFMSMSLEQQQNLLHVLQDSQVHSSVGLKSIDVRILVASSSSVDKAMSKGGLLRALYDYVSILPITVPNLRERQADILPLVDDSITRFCQEYRLPKRVLDPQVETLLQNYSWPGNVRELINKIKRALLICDGDVIGLEHFDFNQQPQQSSTLKAIREKSECEALKRALENHDGQVMLVAKELKISRATMYRLLNKYNLLPNSGSESSPYF